MGRNARGWDLGGVRRVEQVPEARTYTLRAHTGELAVRIEINGALFPAAWHQAMLHDLMRRWVERVRPPLQLVAGGPRPVAVGSLEDPYLLQPPSGSPESE
jgi:hypothetical protein